MPLSQPLPDHRSSLVANVEDLQMDIREGLMVWTIDNAETAGDTFLVADSKRLNLHQYTNTRNEANKALNIGRLSNSPQTSFGEIFD
ncbi:hypothetical protein [Dyadobacter fermentans]|uniref:hypothetical protein n=1 Tax=Dyadobacter fermentans TaxID=94254 RepID=UPI001CC12142|nr:hypothetical protein [Dyadobacter fermentans]MBZ1362153.1 hypothetical protein [Dyadobacter fermentans]